MDYETMVAPGETQIEAAWAVPIVGGKVFHLCSRYEIDPYKVRITFLDRETGEEKTEEFDIKDVKLSGWPTDFNQGCLSRQR